MSSESKDSIPSVSPIVFYDADCGLCNRFAAFVISRDRIFRYRFAPLSGETVRAANLPAEAFRGAGSVVLKDDAGLSLRSEAALRILTGLGGVYRLAALLRVFPLSFRDRIYDWIAKRRGAFGKTVDCRIHAPNGTQRFLP